MIPERALNELRATIPGAVKPEVVEQLEGASTVRITEVPSGRFIGEVAIGDKGQPLDITVRVESISTGSGGELYGVTPPIEAVE